jgi:hemoglobin-like flavoprotein
MNFMDQISIALDMLGPDIEFLTQMLLDLGERHIRYGATPDLFPPVGDILIATLEECLGSENFTPTMKAAWLEVYNAISTDMIEGLNRRQKKATNRNTIPSQAAIKK